MKHLILFTLIRNTNTKVDYSRKLRTTYIFVLSEGDNNG